MSVQVTIEAASKAEAELIAQRLPVKARAAVVEGFRRNPPRREKPRGDEGLYRRRLAELPRARAPVGQGARRRRGARLPLQWPPRPLISCTG